MVPVIGEDEELEECTFMPREYRGQQDNALRKWSKQDLATKGTGGVIGGGNFGEKYMCIERYALGSSTAESVHVQLPSV